WKLLAIPGPQHGDQVLLSPELFPLFPRLGADHHFNATGRERIGAVVVAASLHDGKLDVREIEGNLAKTASVVAGLLERCTFRKIGTDPHNALIQVRQELRP